MIRSGRWCSVSVLVEQGFSYYLFNCVLDSFSSVSFFPLNLYLRDGMGLVLGHSALGFGSMGSQRVHASMLELSVRTGLGSRLLGFSIIGFWEWLTGWSRAKMNYFFGILHHGVSSGSGLLSMSVCGVVFSFW